MIVMVVMVVRMSMATLFNIYTMLKFFSRALAVLVIHWYVVNSLRGSRAMSFLANLCIS